MDRSASACKSEAEAAQPGHGRTSLQAIRDITSATHVIPKPRDRASGRLRVFCWSSTSPAAFTQRMDRETRSRRAIGGRRSFTTGEWYQLARGGGEPTMDVLVDVDVGDHRTGARSTVAKRSKSRSSGSRGLT